ncbi:hypothetical protein [Azospirillum sp. TSO35-2]|nr:hypothetical protein [Azospirillum sp. TSO35-2]
MVLRLGKLCGNGPALWLTLRAQHDLNCLGREMATDLAAIPALDAA